MLILIPILALFASSDAAHISLGASTNLGVKGTFTLHSTG